MTRTIAVAVVLSMTVAVVPAHADENAAPSAAPTIAVAAPISQRLNRPKTLPALYASYAALQALDVYSTKAALSRGAREANPLMQGAVGDTSSFVALKSAVAITTIVSAERLWKKNRAAAIAVMVASNGVAAIVATRNARTLKQLR